MSILSRSHSSARGDEGYFEWRANMERRYLGCNQEATCPGNVSPPLEVHGAWPAEEPIPTRRATREESSDSTRIS
ncbi:hypothetical protein AAG906_011691 [Vitis piasezkii]